MRNFYKKLAVVCTTIALFTFVATSQTTVNYKIIDANDDLEERLAAGGDALGSVDATSTDLELGCETAPEPQIIGLLFRGVAIPVGATITNAYVQFQCDELDAQVISLNIAGIKEANTIAPFSLADFCISSRPKTTATVANWSPPEWAVESERGVAQQTPDIKTVVQEIVNLAGWSSGNNMGILIWNEDIIKQHRTAEAFEGDPVGVAELFVTYTTVGVADVVGSTVSMYPNPSTGRVTIKNPSAGKFGYAIYNVIGKVVKSRDDIAGSTAEVDMSSSAKGTYFVEVTADAKTFKSKLILK